ncbi:MAG: methyltransferase domain-containing protein [Prevotellaceae bacterium]|jgi:2-polyprenyl-3-methyl-5-hydroxy-6-metoxy-1,4-benzoquinol methylase|nr:methyltransferase domain-containing protein [Prevotellaceae bacterium]
MKEFTCPVCGASVGNALLQCKDMSVSNEIFDICLCNSCLFAFTFPQPKPENIGKYYNTEDYISHTDTRKGIVNKLYHIVRKRNIENKLHIVNSLNTGSKNLADIGCGTGYFLDKCLKNAWNVEGAEPDGNARKIAETRINKAVFSSIDGLEKSGKKFDVITLWHVFEHLHDINASLQQLKQLIEPTGRLVLALPNHTSFDAEHYRAYWAGYDVPRHLSHFSPKSIQLLAEKHQLKLEKIIPMKYDAYYISMLSEGLKGAGKIKSLYSGLKYGLMSNCKARKSGNYSSLIYVLKN